MQMSNKTNKIALCPGTEGSRSLVSCLPWLYTCNFFDHEKHGWHLSTSRDAIHHINKDGTILGIMSATCLLPKHKASHMSQPDVAAAVLPDSFQLVSRSQLLQISGILSV